MASDAGGGGTAAPQPNSKSRRRSLMRWFSIPIAGSFTDADHAIIELESSSANDDSQGSSSSSPGAVAAASPSPDQQDSLASTPPEPNECKQGPRERLRKHNDCSYKALVVEVGAVLYLMISQGLILASGVFITQLNDHYGETRLHIYLYSGATAMALATGPLFGIIFDNYGPWIPALVCILGQSASFVMLGLFNGIPQRAAILVLGRGIASGAMLSVGVAIPGKLFDKKQGLAQGVVMAGSSAGGMVFSRLYKPVFDKYGWFMGNVIIATVVGGIGVVAFLCLIPYNSVVPTEARPESGKLKQLKLDLRGLLRVDRLFSNETWKKRSSFAWLIGGQFCHEIGLFGVSASLPLIAESMEATKGMGENVLLALCVVSFCTRPCAGFIADKYGYFESLVCSMTLSGILLFSLGTWVHLGTPAHLFVVAVTWSLTSSPWIPYYTGAIGEITDAREYGRFVGISNMAMSPACFSAAPLLEAIRSSAGAGAVFAVVGSTVVLGMVMAIMSWRAHDQAQGHAKTFFRYAVLPFEALYEAIVRMLKLAIKRNPLGLAQQDSGDLRV